MKFNRDLLKEDMHEAFPSITFIIAFITLSNFLLGKVCAFRILAGIPCPGCGLTRAFVLLLQGKFKEATVMHPFWMPVLLLLTAFILCRYFIADEETRKKAGHIIWAMVIVMLVCMFVFYCYRMVMYYPEREPMVYDENNIIKDVFTSVLSYVKQYAIMPYNT